MSGVSRSPDTFVTSFTLDLASSKVGMDFTPVSDKITRVVSPFAALLAHCFLLISSYRIAIIGVSSLAIRSTICKCVMNHVQVTWPTATAAIAYLEKANDHCVMFLKQRGALVRAFKAPEN